MYNPNIGRFLSIDPIDSDFPWVSPYNYAENRPIDGIDLWGLQYVSANDAFFRVEGLQTWFDTDQHLSGVDLIGREYIGTSAPLRVVNFSLPEGHHPTGTSGEMMELVRNVAYRRAMVEASVKRNKDGSLNWSFRATKSLEKLESQLRFGGRVGLVAEAVNLTRDIINAVRAADAYFYEIDEFNVQLDYVEKSWQGVVDGINAGFFTEGQISIEGLSQVADYLYRGTTIEDEGLQQVAERISAEILNNAPETIFTPESGLDNFKRERQFSDPPVGPIEEY